MARSFSQENGDWDSLFTPYSQIEVGWQIQGVNACDTVTTAAPPEGALRWVNELSSKSTSTSRVIKTAWLKPFIQSNEDNQICYTALVFPSVGIQLWCWLNTIEVCLYELCAILFVCEKKNNFLYVESHIFYSL